MKKNNKYLLIPITKGLLSPTWFVADLIKKYMNRTKGRLGKFKAIFFLNRFWLVSSLIIFAVITVCDSHIDSFLDTTWQFILGYVLLLSRINEIFFAFIGDAFDKLSHQKSYSFFKMRLNLAFSSYLELIVSYGSLYYLLAQFDSVAIKGICSPVDALYFSGVTITTLGYGDITPTQWYTKFLSVYEVLCGFSLLLVSFAIYANRAMNKAVKTVS